MVVQAIAFINPQEERFAKYGNKYSFTKILPDSDEEDDGICDNGISDSS